MEFIKQNVATTILLGPFVDKTDGLTLKTDATTVADIDHTTDGIFISKNGGTSAIRHQPVTASSIDSYGMMKVRLSTYDTSAAGTLDVLFAKSDTYLPVHARFMVVPANVYDSMVGLDLLDVNTTTVGSVPLNITVKDTVGDIIDAASVWLTTDEEGINVIASGTSNDEGVATFLVDPGTKYVWVRKSGKNFTNPTKVVVS